jgi:hypothetical protein
MIYFHGMKEESAGGFRTTYVFLSHLYIKTIILPRQARDKHRKKLKKAKEKGGFSLYVRVGQSSAGAKSEGVLRPRAVQVGDSAWPGVRSEQGQFRKKLISQECVM